MTNYQEIPTDELLYFQAFPTVHTAENDTIPISESQIAANNLEGNLQNSPDCQASGDAANIADGSDPKSMKSFWSISYYQEFFDVDTRDIVDRIFASITPKWDNSLKHHLPTKPDLYGPFWISVTLIFTIAISANIADYLQHTNTQYHWKYNFHLVSYATTIICLYVTLIPFILWGLLKWSSQINDVVGLNKNITPEALELICMYGYSLSIYIPVSILCTTQNDLVQWSLLLVAAFLSGLVLLLTLMPALRLSKYKFLLMVGIILCQLLLAAGFMLYFYHAPRRSVSITKQVVPNKPQSLAPS